MSRHFEKCGRYAGPLKTSHFLFDLDRFQEIQLLTRNLSKAQTQQYLAEHLKTTAAPMSSLHYFSCKKIMKTTSFPETNSFNNSSEKCRLKKKCHAFFSNPFFSPSYIFHLLTAQLQESTKCFFSQASVVSSSIVAAHTKLDVAEEQINLLHLRGFILGVALAAGRGPQHHYAVRQFSPPEPAPFKTCYHNTRILSNSHHQKYAK